MSVSSIIMSEYLVLSDLVGGVDDVLRAGNRRPWEVLYATKDEKGVTLATFDVRTVRPLATGMFRASGSIDGNKAVIIYFGEPGVPSHLYMR